VFSSRARYLVAFIFLVLISCSLACKQKPTPEYRRYEISGRVVSIDKNASQVVLAHKDIPGFMKAMTMGFKIKEKWALDALGPGDQLNGTLVVDPDGAYIENPVITKASGTQPEPSTSTMHDPQVGDKVPDFALIAQTGKRIHLGQYLGAPLMLTFIYTRCPLPDYCIRMSSNFAETARLLKQNDPELYAQLRMLSISIDPEYDKPEVLRKYAKNYAGEIDPNLQHWTFATGSPEQVKQVADFFGLAYEPQSGQIIHSLRTAIIDKDGKIAFVNNGNSWKPEDAVRDLQSLK
jgi:protein SCO1